MVLNQVQVLVTGGETQHGDVLLPPLKQLCVLFRHLWELENPIDLPQRSDSDLLTYIKQPPAQISRILTKEEHRLSKTMQEHSRRLRTTAESVST